MLKAKDRIFESSKRKISHHTQGNEPPGNNYLTSHKIEWRSEGSDDIIKVLNVLKNKTKTHQIVNQESYIQQNYLSKF